MANANCPDAEFCVGDKVKHVGTGDGKIPSGTGKVECVEQWADCKGYSYKVRCDKTGDVIPYLFKASELSCC